MLCACHIRLHAPLFLQGCVNLTAAVLFMHRWGHHTEFAVGLDWSVLKEGLLASAGWDETVGIWHFMDPHGP